MSPAAEQQPTATVSAPFRAAWPGWCDGCSRPIVAGQLIRTTPSGALHDGCTPWKPAF